MRYIRYHHHTSNFNAAMYRRRKGQERWQRQRRRSLDSNIWWAHAFFPQLSSRDDSSKHGRKLHRVFFLTKCFEDAEGHLEISPASTWMAYQNPQDLVARTGGFLDQTGIRHWWSEKSTFWCKVMGIFPNESCVPSYLVLQHYCSVRTWTAWT